MTAMLAKDKPNFGRAQNTATKLLLKQDIKSLKIDARNFKFDIPIVMDSIQHYASVVGRDCAEFICDQFSGCCVVKHPRAHLILYDESVSDDRRKHWGIVHEIGHVCLGHDADTEKEEIEAHFFAAQLIAPEIVLFEMARRRGGLYREDIQRFFYLSYKAANKRWGTLQSRKNFHKYTKSDKILLEKFEPILNRELPVRSGRSNWDAVIG